MAKKTTRPIETTLVRLAQDLAWEYANEKPGFRDDELLSRARHASDLALWLERRRERETELKANPHG